MKLANMEDWLQMLKKAIIQKDKHEILRLYDFNEMNSSFNWTNVPEHLQSKYDELIDAANEILEQ